MIIRHEIELDDEESATTLMVYHLKLACAYFEATHDDRGLFANKVIKAEMKSEGWKNAASAFVDVLCSSYENEDDSN